MPKENLMTSWCLCTARHISRIYYSEHCRVHVFLISLFAIPLATKGNRNFKTKDFLGLQKFASGKIFSWPLLVSQMAGTMPNCNEKILWAHFALTHKKGCPLISPCKTTMICAVSCICRILMTVHHHCRSDIWPATHKK